MLLYVAGTVLGTVGACYAAIKLFFPWLLADFRYIRKVMPLIKQYESYAKRGLFFADVFEEMVRKIPDKACILYQDEKYTYNEVNGRANQIARAALGLGLKKGDTVAMIMYNEPAFLWTYIGMLKIGVVTSLINTNLRGKPLQHSITVSSTNMIIVGPDKDLQEAVLAVLPEFPDMAVYTNSIQIGSPPTCFSDQLHDKAGTMATDNTDSALRADTKASDPAIYIFTSGTTGLPKAATVSVQKYLAGMILGGLFGVKDTDRVFTCLPLYHSSALMVSFAPTIMFGATFVLERKFSKSRYLDTCRKHNVTVITYIGEMCRYLLTNEKSEADRDHSIRLAIGNGMRADIYQEFKDRFAIPHVGEFYGSTEGSMGMVNSDDVPGACGRLSPFLRKILPSGLYKWDVENECLVRNDKGHCILVPIGTPGLLLTAINKKQMFYGYKGRKDLTESKIVRNVDKDGDCFYNTGDLMVMDKNYSSYFSDRIGDTFRWKGENVSTTEVSNCLTELDFVIDACVYGVIIPGHDGRAGMATLLVNQAIYSDITAADYLQTFHQHCKDTLPSYARPMFLRICFDDLDMTSTLKQNKIRLKKEGFDVKVIKEDVYYFDKSSDGYKPLTEKVDISGQVF